ncbi:MAG: DUF4384 domain-containing protein [Acidobacteriota bacterium]|nr:DUF4384 domain-containing protein [Acidobacteriota bacterium]
MNNIFNVPLHCACGMALLYGSFAPVAAQQPDTESSEGEARPRGLWNDAFRQQRITAKGTKIVVRAKKIAPASAQAVKELGNSFVGLTLWRMRRSSGGDPVRFRGLVHPEDLGDTEEWTPERVSLSNPVRPKELVRLSIESARKGYLYVIDRDSYPDGTTGPANLIFPTNRLRGGDNKVEPGKLIEIPDADDKPPAFRLVKTRPDQTAVLLTIIVAPEPIPGLTIGTAAQKLTEEQVKEWEKKWGSQVSRLESNTDAGKAYTAAEQAAAKQSQALGEDDPVPLTLFHCNAKQGDTMLVSVPIILGKR